MNINNLSVDVSLQIFHVIGFQLYWPRCFIQRH